MGSRTSRPVRGILRNGSFFCGFGSCTLVYIVLYKYYRDARQAGQD